MKKRIELAILAMLGFFAMSVKTSHPFFAVFAVFLALLYCSNLVWNKYAYKQISGKIVLHQNRIFPNDLVSAELILENKGFVTLFGVKVYFDVPEYCTIVSDYFTSKEDNLNGIFTYFGTFNIGRKQVYRIPITITGHRRGAYRVRNVRIVLTDLLGINVSEKEFASSDELLVYPQEIELQRLKNTSRIPQGDVVVRRWIHDDIFFPVGSRPYQPGDSFNRIDFKGTARLQQLLTKQFDYTAHTDICVIANMMTTDRNWKFDRDLFDRTMSIVARIARESLHKDLRFSFFANAQTGKGLRAFELPSSSGRSHFRRVLEVLARFTFFQAIPFPIVTANVKQRFPNGAVVVVVTAYFDEQVRYELNQLVLAGFEVFLVDSKEEVPTVSHWNYAPQKVRGTKIG